MINGPLQLIRERTEKVWIFLHENPPFLKVCNINFRIFSLSNVTKTRNGSGGIQARGERANEKWEQNLTWNLESSVSDFISSLLFCSHFSFLPFPVSVTSLFIQRKSLKAHSENKEKETLFSLTFLSDISLDPLWQTSRKTVMIDKVSWKKQIGLTAENCSTNT